MSASADVGTPQDVVAPMDGRVLSMFKEMAEALEAMNGCMDELAISNERGAKISMQLAQQLLRATRDLQRLTSIVEVLQEEVASLARTINTTRGQQ